MRKCAAFILLTLLPLATLSHCWWQNRGVPRVEWQWQFEQPGDDSPNDAGCHEGALYVVGRNEHEPRATSLVEWRGFVVKLKGGDGPSLLWQRWVGRDDCDTTANGVCANQTGVYVVGSTRGPLPPGSRPARADTDALVVRYTTDGGVVWTRHWGGPGDDRAWGVAADPTGVYVLVDTRFPRGLGGDRANARVTVRKYSLHGAELWARRVDLPGHCWAAAVAADPTGVYVAGETRAARSGGGVQQTGGAFVTKYRSDGQVLWTDQFGKPGGLAADVCAGSDGIYVVGLGSWPSVGQNRMAFARHYRHSGELVWEMPAADRRYSTWLAAVFADESAVYSLGSLAAPRLRLYHRFGVSDGCLAQYSSSGELLWIKQLGAPSSAYPFALVGDADHLYAVAAAGFVGTGQDSKVLVTALSRPARR